MEIIKQILTIKPREESGSKTSRKYSFQNNLSLYLLLKNHDKRTDYVYLFDFHDDLVILDSSTNPREIDFYQIKSKDSGNWTLNALTKSEKDKLSILGKLYLNRINFPINTHSLNFISNAPFSFKELKSEEESTKKSVIKASELDKHNLDICLNTIKTEHSISDCDDFETLTSFYVTELSNKDSSTHCLGELTHLIHKLNPENKINSQLAYNQIIGEVSRRTNTTIGDKSLSKLDDLIELKGITKKHFLEFLNKAGLYKSVEEEWLEINSQLEASNVGTIELMKYRKAWRDVSMKLINDIDKIPLRNLQKEINAIINEGIDAGTIKDSSNLKSILDYCYSKINANFYDEYFVKCLAIRMLYEKY